MTEKEARALSWMAGLVASWYLRDDQLPVYYHLKTHRNPFIEAARRYGKTTSILTHVLEQLRAHPGWVCRWCEPNKNQAREIIMPEMDKIQAECPSHLKFKWQTTDSVYIGPHNSRLYLRGVNEDHGDSARGPFANILVADEFGHWSDPEYIVNEALRPQILTTRGQFIFASTPPKDLGHAYYEHKDRAIRDNRFIQRIITDNKGLTQLEIDEFIEETGGINCPAVRRELFCEPVSDPELLVIPEYKEELFDVSDSDYPRPAYCDKYVGCDLGFDDCSAILFGFFDFLTGTLVIEDEIVISGKNSKELAELAIAKEKVIWGDEKPYRRVADNEKQQLYDMSSLYGYSMNPTRKDEKHSAINELRVRFSQKKIKINRRCKSLRYQLKVGVWNAQKSTFSRSEKTGHLDAIDALIYLNRNLVTSHNPWPLNLGMTLDTHHFNPHSPGKAKEAEVLKQIFRPLSHPGG